MSAELAGTLTEEEADEILRNIEELREAASGGSGQKISQAE